MTRFNYELSKAPWDGSNAWGAGKATSELVRNHFFDGGRPVDLIRIPDISVPSPISVSLYRSGPGELPSGRQIIARVYFGVGGTCHEVLVDFTQGATFSVVATSLSLAAILEGAPITPQDIPDEFGISAMGCYGAMTSYPPATLTRAWAPVVGPSAESVRVPIPAFARSMALLGDGVVYTGTSFIRFYDSVAGGSLIVEVPTEVSGTRGVTIPNRARSATYFHLPATTARPIAVFELF